MRARFSDDVAVQIVGKTPRAARPVDHQRYLVGSAWPRKRGLEEEAWVALDDDPLNDPAHPKVRLLDAEVGFDAEAAAWLLSRVRGA